MTCRECNGTRARSKLWLMGTKAVKCMKKKKMNKIWNFFPPLLPPPFHPPTLNIVEWHLLDPRHSRVRCGTSSFFQEDFLSFPFFSVNKIYSFSYSTWHTSKRAREGASPQPTKPETERLLRIFLRGKNRERNLAIFVRRKWMALHRKKNWIKLRQNILAWNGSGLVLIIMITIKKWYSRLFLLLLLDLNPANIGEFFQKWIQVFYIARASVPRRPRIFFFQGNEKIALILIKKNLHKIPFFLFSFQLFFTIR